MRKISLVGIGAGNPEYVTMQAVRVLNQVDVVFLVDKGDAKASLVQVREEICARYITADYRVVELEDPPRDRTAEAYQEAVDDWRLRRAVLFEQAILDNLGDDGHGAFLVWGDPSLYDSTLGVVDHILTRGNVVFEYEVVPGITSIQALAARHRIPLNRTAEPIHVTTGRLLKEGLPGDNVVVMLDAAPGGRGSDRPRAHDLLGRLPRHARTRC